MRKVAGFIGSTGLAVLMTAAGLVVDVVWLTVAGLVLLALSGLLFALSLRKDRKVTDEKKRKSGMGDYNTIVGKVSMPENLGDGNTIIGATDDNGNTIIDQPTSIGFKAGYAPDSVIIGAFAGPSERKRDDR